MRNSESSSQKLFKKIFAINFSDFFQGTEKFDFQIKSEIRMWSWSNPIFIDIYIVSQRS